MKNSFQKKKEEEEEEEEKAILFFSSVLLFIPVLYSYTVGKTINIIGRTKVNSTEEEYANRPL